MTSSVPELGPGAGTNWGRGAGPQNGVVPACPVLWCRGERGCKTPGKCGARFCLLGCPIPCIPPLQPKFLSPNPCPAAPYPESPVPASRSPVSPHPAAPAGHILLPVAPHPAAPSTHILLPVFPHPASYARVPRILQPRILHLPSCVFPHPAASLFRILQHQIPQTVSAAPRSPWSHSPTSLHPSVPYPQGLPATNLTAHIPQLPVPAALYPQSPSRSPVPFQPLPCPCP